MLHNVPFSPNNIESCLIESRLQSGTGIIVGSIFYRRTPWPFRSGIPYFLRTHLPPLLFALLFALLLISPLALKAQEARVNPHRIDFSGSWEMDYQLSDHAAEKTRQLYVQARSMAQRAAERAQNSGRMIDPQILNVQSIVGLGRLVETIAQATVLTVKQTANHIVVERNDDFALVCDFQALGIIASPVGREGCFWDEDQLIFQVALPEGLNVIHRLSLAADRSRINVATTVNISGIRYPFTLNRVYMPFEPGAGQFACEYTIANQTTCTLRGNGDS